MSRSKRGGHPGKRPLTPWQKEVLANVAPGSSRDPTLAEVREMVAEGLAEPEALIATWAAMGGGPMTYEQAVAVSRRIKESAA